VWRLPAVLHAPSVVSRSYNSRYSAAAVPLPDCLTCKLCSAWVSPPQVDLQMVPLTEQYWDRVVARCISEIRQGRTPNPDVLCNSRWVRGLSGHQPACYLLAASRCAFLVALMALPGHACVASAQERGSG
jgi:hypothetical protein